MRSRENSQTDDSIRRQHLSSTPFPPPSGNDTYHCCCSRPQNRSSSSFVKMPAPIENRRGPSVNRDDERLSPNPPPNPAFSFLVNRFSYSLIRPFPPRGLSLSLSLLLFFSLLLFSRKKCVSLWRNFCFLFASGSSVSFSSFFSSRQQWRCFRGLRIGAHCGGGVFEALSPPYHLFNPFFITKNTTTREFLWSRRLIRPRVSHLSRVLFFSYVLRALKKMLNFGGKTYLLTEKVSQRKARKRMRGCSRSRPKL